MAETKWNEFGNDDDARNQRPMMNLPQTKGERLYDQALSLYTSGQFAQAEQLLDKAIAMEPSNALFQETRNSFQVTRWHSGYSHHTMPKSQPPQQLPMGSSRLHHENRRLQGNTNSTNQSTFPHAAGGHSGLWKPPHNGAKPPQYTSSTVADSMFGPSNWVPTDGISNHAQHTFSQGQIGNPYAARNSSGPKQGSVPGTSRPTMQDNVWGQWNDPTMEANSAGETSWLDLGCQQTNVPWTEEPRKAASLPNNTRRNVTCNASQSSLRGSTERFSLKERHNPGGRISPQTWHSEGTCSESNYGLDNFEDVSNKVQEWLVKNDSTEINNPLPHDPDYSKIKKMKKKKKKKIDASGLQDFSEKKFQPKDFQHVKTMESVTKDKASPTFGSQTLTRETTDVKSSQIPTSTASYHKQDSYERTLPFFTKYGNNSQGTAPSKSGTNNSNSSKSCGVSNKPFFDPKRIFSSTNSATGLNPTSSEKQEDSSDKIQFDTRTKTHFSRSNSSLLNADEGLKPSQNKPSMNEGNTKTRKISQEKEANKGVQENRPNTSGSTESDLSGRMTKEEWEEIIARMYEPLGIPSNHNKSRESVEGASSGAKSKTPEDKSPFHSSGYGSVKTSNTVNSSPESQPSKIPRDDFSRPQKTSKVGNTTSWDKASQEEYIDVKATVTDGVLRSSVPVCRAGASVVSSAPIFSSGKRFSGKGNSYTPVTAPKCSPSFETPVTVTRVSPTMKRDDHWSPFKPVLQAEVEVPVEPFIHLDKTPVATRKAQTKGDDVSGKTKSQGRSVQEAQVKKPATQFTKSVPEPEVKVSAKRLVNLDKTSVAAGKLQTKSDDASVETRSQGKFVEGAHVKKPATQPSKPFWEPSRIFVSKSPETKTTCEIKKTGSSAATNQETANTARSLSSSQGEGQTKVSDANSKSDKESAMPQSSSKATKSSHDKSSFSPGCDEAPSGVEVRNSFHDGTFGQTNAVPIRSSTKYSYVAWKEQNVKKSVRKTSFNADGTKDPETLSKMVPEIPREAAPVQVPSVSTTKENMKDSLTSNSGRPLDPVTRKFTLVDSIETEDLRLPKAVPKAQEFSNSSWKPKDAPTQTRDTSSNGATSSNAAVSPERHDVNKEDRPSSGGAKAKSASSTTSGGPQSWPKYAESNTWTTYPPGSGRQSTDFSSKTARGGASEAREGSHHTSDRSSSGGAKAKSASSTTSDGPQYRPKYTESEAQTSYQTHSGRQSTDFSSKTARGGASEAREGSHHTSDRSSFGGAKAKSASSTTSDGPQYRPKYGESEPQTTFSSNSKTARGGTTETPRQRTSGSRSADAQTTGRSSNFRTRDDDFRSTQGSRRDTSEARAPSDVKDDDDSQAWYRWTKVIGRTLRWAVCFLLFLLLILLACLFSTIKIGAKYAWHILQELRNVIRESRQSDKSRGNSGGQKSKSSANHGPDSKFKATRSVDIPTSGEAAIKRLLHCDPNNPYKVLGVSSEANQEDIKKYYRRQCMLVHPDKNDLPHAREAFQILQKAYDTLSDPDKRREFEMESRNAHFGEEMEEFVKKMEQKMDEVLNTLKCNVCDGKHRRYEIDRPWYSARYCNQHKICHPASEGDVWVESTHFGFKWHYYAMMEDRIFEITEWAACQNMKYMEPNTCEVRYRVGTARTRAAPRQRPPGFPNQHAHQRSHERSHEHGNDMTEEMLKDFLRRQFQQSESRNAASSGNYGGGDANRGNQDKGRRPKKHRKKKR